MYYKWNHNNINDVRRVNRYVQRILFIRYYYIVYRDGWRRRVRILINTHIPIQATASILYNIYARKLIILNLAVIFTILMIIRYTRGTSLIILLCIHNNNNNNIKRIGILRAHNHGIDNYTDRSNPKPAIIRCNCRDET